MKRLKRILKEFITYDRVYYDGKLTNLVIAFLSFFIILLVVIYIILFR